MSIFNVFEMLGTVAFAMSGALLGVKKGLDLFGIVMLAVTTALGGGIVRDIVIGNTPPMSFREPFNFVVSTLAALSVMLLYKNFNKLSNVIMIFDAIGLGIFTAIGANVAVVQNYNQPFIVVSLGLITGIGGGILRDVFAKEIPYVFRKEIYAVASIAGGLAFYYTNVFIGKSFSLYVCTTITVVIRLVAIYMHLDLPVPQKPLDEAEQHKIQG